jgi:hypothetical protein
MGTEGTHLLPSSRHKWAWTMTDRISPVSRYATPDVSPPRVARSATAKKRTFVIVDAADFPVWAELHGADTALHLELIRLSGLSWVQKREGWVSLPAATLNAIGLKDRRIRGKAVQRGVRRGWLEARRVAGSGSQYEYRLRRPSADLVDLASARKSRPR